MSLRTDDFDYELPPELIAQSPTEARDSSRLLVLDRHRHQISHRYFFDLPEFLHVGDVLVLNRSRVIPARLKATKPTGGTVELLLVRSLSSSQWLAMARPARKLRPGMRLSIQGSPLQALLGERVGEDQWHVEFLGPGEIEAEIRAAGRLPLPPYIRDTTTPEDRYQTVYADREGSIAAPTAGLHFSNGLLERVEQSGVSVQRVTLHVGVGTFKPVTAEHVAEHTMHAEWGEVPEATADAVARSRQQGARIIAVGTTTTRLLESAWVDGRVRPFAGETNRFIFPGYHFQAVDVMITNFHLPRSTLLMLVSAFAGREFILEAYREAVDRKYRFFSFGDAMLIL